jgi:rod shape determining protein RodA
LSSIGNAIKTFIKNTYKILLALCVFASGFGILMVHSATLSSLSANQTISRETLIMAIAISLGLFLCIIISLIDYEIILKMWPVFSAICILLMLSLFVIGVAPSDRQDARSWLSIGGVYFQPSELLKIGFVLTFSFHLDVVRNKINDFKNILLLCVHGAIPIILVIATGDLGSALVFVAIFTGMLFVAGLHLRYFAGALAFCMAGLPLLWIKFFSDFQKYRFLAVYYPQALPKADYKALIYQQQQSVNAIGAGQIWGKGLFKGTFTQNGFIPVDDSDMIFAVIGEELGFAGAIGLIVLLGIIILKIIKVGTKSKDYVGCSISYGIAILIGSQAIINIGMCLKLLPCIGITLPFISSGGSSNLCIYIGIGIIMSIYRANRESGAVNFRLSHIRTPFSEI